MKMAENGWSDSMSTEVAKLLTHVEASVREKTLQKIVKYLKQREMAVGRIEDLELQKLWKALFYCFWLTDKVPIQLEMGRTLSSLSECFARRENVDAFFSNYFFVMRREWGTIDYLRLNKYNAWVRQMVNKWLSLLVQSDYNELDEFVDTFRDQVLLPVQQDGLRMQVAFVYLNELIKAAGSDLEESRLRTLLSPFLCVLIEPPTEPFFIATVKDVFEKLLTNVFVDAADPSVIRSFAQFDKSKVASAIFDMAAQHESLNSQRRKALYALAKKFDAGVSVTPLSASVESSESKKMRVTARDADEEMPISKKPAPKEKAKEKTTTEAKNGRENEAAKNAKDVAKTKADAKTMKSPEVKVNASEVKSKGSEAKLGKPSEVKTSKKEEQTKKIDKASLLSLAKRSMAELRASSNGAAAPAGKVMKTKPVSPTKDEDEKSASDEDQNNAMDQSFVSTTSSKNVRFSHKDIVKIPVINKRMKETSRKMAAELGQPAKSLLKKVSSVKPSVPSILPGRGQAAQHNGGGNKKRRH